MSRHKIELKEREYNKAFGAKLKLLREMNGFKTKQFAEAINVTPAMYSSYEGGHNRMYLYRIDTICKKFNLDREFLINADSLDILTHPKD